MATTEVEIVCNEKGEETAVIVPIDLWREIESERETAYVLSSPANRQRLTEALARTETISLEAALAKLGV
jgi:PHD/YefM family antitoxin component YafN of YafNO toxin-antitoxin module